jgi:hypothetical protein
MESLKQKAHTCFEMAAKATSTTFATFEAKEDYEKRIMLIFHEFVKEFMEGLTWSQKDTYGILIQKLSLCLDSYPSMLRTHAQSLEARYMYHTLPSFEIYLKHKELRINDLLSKDSAVFTLDF